MFMFMVKIIQHTICVGGKFNIKEQNVLIQTLGYKDKCIELK